jgi:hypothetical protein
VGDDAVITGRKRRPGCDLERALAEAPIGVRVHLVEKTPPKEDDSEY